MRIHSLIMTFIFVFYSTLMASQESFSQQPEMMTLKGACTKLVVGGRERFDCSPLLLNTVHQNGRTGFYFVTDNGDAITFSGMGQRQVKITADEVIQPVDGVIITLNGKRGSFSAVGECSYANPNNGPSWVNCRAKSRQGVYEAFFQTDGNPPLPLSPPLAGSPTAPAKSEIARQPNGSAKLGGLPFVDGSYATRPSFCNPDARNEDSSPILDIKENGKRIVGYEFDCAVRKMSASGKKLSFQAVCEAEGDTEVRKEAFTDVTDASFKWRKKTYVSCGKAVPDQ